MSARREAAARNAAKCSAAGMSMRDAFALAALPALLASALDVGLEAPVMLATLGNVPAAAYEVADAMLLAREASRV